jgi:hypothetical protein
VPSSVELAETPLNSPLASQSNPHDAPRESGELMGFFFFFWFEKRRKKRFRQRLVPDVLVLARAVKCEHGRGCEKSAFEEPFSCGGAKREDGSAIGGRGARW